MYINFNLYYSNHIGVLMAWLFVTIGAITVSIDRSDLKTVSMTNVKNFV